MKMVQAIPETLLAPCGINCMVCYVHLKKKKSCEGCRGQDENKPEHCRKCKIKECAQTRRIKFCGDCDAYPCALIKRLDRSYRQRYQISLIENATRLKTTGASQFLLEEREKWTCSQCGGVISLHDGVCSDCGQALGRI